MVTRRGTWRKGKARRSYRRKRIDAAIDDTAKIDGIQEYISNSKRPRSNGEGGAETCGFRLNGQNWVSIRSLRRYGGVLKKFEEGDGRASEGAVS